MIDVSSNFSPLPAKTTLLPILPLDLRILQEVVDFIIRKLYF